MFIQQGDVLLIPGNIPMSATPKPLNKRGVVLAEGETTGHAHVISDVGKVTLFEDKDKMYLRVLEETTLVHEEHKVVTIPAGDYTVNIVQEYDHFKEEARRVAD